MAKQVRVGVIGCGNIGKTHAKAFVEIAGVDLAACCDGDGARAEALAELHGVPHVFTDVGELLRSGTVDAVTVCTPHPTPADIVVAAAAAGVHVICEKPLAVSIGEANRMVAAAEAGGIKFAGIFQRRFWPAAQRIRTAIDDGKLGRITHGECRVYIWRPEAYFAADAWRGKWATEGGGALMNQAVHAIDLLQWYLGPVTEVFGRWAKLRDGDYIDVEDTAVATLVCANGARATGYLRSSHLRLSGPQVGRSFKEVALLGYQGELKHVAEPYFGFTETSRYGEAGTLPRFDMVDSLPGVNDSASGERSFEVGLKQHLLGRSGPGAGFADLARLRVATRYHATPIILSDGRYKKGWASLDTDLDVEPDDRWRISLRRSSDIGAGGSDNALSIDVKARDGGRFNLAYFSTGINRFLVRQQGLQFGGLQRFWDDRVRLEFSANYDFRIHGFASSQVALAYVQPCVAYVLKYSHLALNTALVSGGREDRVDLTLTLRGLGDLFSFRR